jgi:hypothetical protein
VRKLDWVLDLVDANCGVSITGRICRKAGTHAKQEEVVVIYYVSCVNGCHFQIIWY